MSLYCLVKNNISIAENILKTAKKMNNIISIYLILLILSYTIFMIYLNWRDWKEK